MHGIVMAYVPCIINQTPHQIFVAGALRLQHSGLQAVDF